VVEEIGVERARAAAADADLVLYLAEPPLDDVDRAELEALADKLVIEIYTKADVVEAPAGAMAISAVTGVGMPALLARLDELVRERFAAPENSPTIVNERQRAAVAECEAALQASLGSIDAGANEELIVVDLYRAANALGALTGAITRDDILHEIFSRFCIGK
jgi:tRNA modification GTPase